MTCVFFPVLLNSETRSFQYALEDQSAFQLPYREGG